jgi:hypothetical protein
MPVWTAVACCVIVMAGLAGPRPAAAQAPSDDLEISVPETVWGFDGKAVKETFTPLSILVQNPGPRIASGTMRLDRQMPLDSVKEPPIEIPFDVPPFEERWVQIAPYIVDEFTPWQLTWGKKPSQTVEIPQPRLGDVAVVLMVNPNDRPRSTGVLRRFRSNLFPASVTATDGLETVFLNSIPDLQGARLQSFLDWLHRGGHIVLLHGDDQKYPTFPSALAALNDPADVFHVGSGEVRRLALDASDVNEKQLRLTSRPDRRDVTQRESAVKFNDPYKTYNGRYPWSRDRAVLEKLEGVSRFHRRWWVIYPLALLYLLAVFPGSYAIAHTPQGVRRFYIAYFAIAIAFSWAFKTLGGVGGGDRNRIRSATIAHQLSPGVFDCSQWCSMAAVDGGRYTLTHEGSGRCYAHNEEFETPHGLITAGAGAKYELEIPVASTRTVVTRMRATASPVTVQLQSMDFVERKLNSCKVAFAGLPNEPIEAFACHRELIFRLQKNGDAWTSDRRRSTSTSVFITDLDRVPNYTLNLRGRPTIENKVTKDFYRSLERPLIGNSFQTRGHVESWSAMLPAGCVRLMALVQGNRDFAGTASTFDDVQGCVLYVIDLPIKED